MRAAIALSLATGAVAACAAPVDVDVLGRDGKPLAEAVVFLESASAKAASRPLAGVEKLVQ